MRTLLRAGALALALTASGLAGCATAPGPTPAGAHAITPATRAMLAAESAFNAAATAELDAKSTGLLSGDKAAQADAIRKQAFEALKIARLAYQVGQTPDLVGILLLTNQLLALAGKPPVVAPVVAPIPTL